MKREILFRGKAIKNTFSINEKEAKIKIGDWIYGAVIPFDDGIDLIYERDPNNPKICGCHGIEVDHNTVGQFTGLHDKNGKEIYEGDVIKWLEINGTNNNSFLEPPDDRIVEMSGVVEFKDGVFSVLNEDKLLDVIVAYLTRDYQANEPNMFEYVYNLDKFPNITIDDMYICEVIGNIHDNKELLTQN